MEEMVLSRKKTYMIEDGLKVLVPAVLMAVVNPNPKVIKATLVSLRRTLKVDQQGSITVFQRLLCLWKGNPNAK